MRMAVHDSPERQSFIMSIASGTEDASPEASSLSIDLLSTQSRDLYRPLLPCPQVLVSSQAQTAAAAVAPSSEKSSRPPRNNITLACNECKAKKARCDGGYPCTRCTGKGVDCRFDQNGDRRRVRAAPAENLILRERISQYQRLFTIMRDTPAKDAVRILHLLRSCSNGIQQSPGNAGDDLPIDELLHLVEEPHQSPGSPESIRGVGRSQGSLISIDSAHVSPFNTSDSKTGSPRIPSISRLDYQLQNSTVC